MNSSCSQSMDDVWGPQVDRCLREFDFTLFFEQSTLSILPSALCLPLAAFRTWHLRHAQKMLTGKILGGFKLLGMTVVAALQLTLMVLWCKNTSIRTTASIPAAVLSFLAAVALTPLVWLEQYRCIRPSTLICTYLLFVSLLDLAQLRTLWLINDSSPIAAVFSALFAVRIVILGVECLDKTKGLIYDDDQKRSPEDTSGVLSRSFFAWLNPFMFLGFRRAIVETDLYPLPEDTDAQALKTRLQKSWPRGSSHQTHRLWLIIARAVKWRLFAPMIPRICMVGFTICQPLLLLELIRSLDSSASPNHRYGLLGAYALVYLGLAVSRAWYFHQLFKFLAVIRAGLVSIIYNQTTQLSLVASDSSSATTIMSADVERIIMGLRSVHDIWANVIQVALATWLLERQIGVGVVGPLGLAAIFGWGALKIGQASVNQQKDWLSKLEKRITVTTDTIASIHSIKMLGLDRTLMELIQRLRVVELHAAGIYRRWEVGALVIGFFPILISPVIAFATFIAVSDARNESLDAARMFVSLSFLSLMSQPLSMLFQCGPQLMSMIGCLDRIEQFLASPTRIPPNEPSALARTGSCTTSPGTSEVVDDKIIHQPSNDFVIVEKASFGWKPAKPILQDINLTLPKDQLIFVAGPVGCGKSTLLKGLLGEAAWSQGTVKTPTNVSFCDQTPWVMNRSVRENIVMFSAEDPEFYEKVIHACALTPDLLQLPAGDDTVVGSRGRTLSGGQKQRLSIARAVFARRALNVWDDVLSGLDPTTEKHVFLSLFGPDGLLRGQGRTTIMATHAVHWLPYADHIVCIGTDGRLIEQGSFAELSQNDGYIGQLKIQPHEELSKPQEPTPPLPAQATKTPTTKEVEIFNPSKPRGVYRYYMKATGSGLSWVFALLGITFAFLYIFPYVWAKWWTDANDDQPGQRQGYYLGIYAMLQILCLFVLTAFAWHAVITIITSAGTSLHQILITTMLRAPGSFFDTTDAGQILNRFSQDMQMIDNELPSATFKIAYNGLVVLGQLLLIMNISYWIAISYPVIFIVLIGIQKIYLQTSRRLRHLELEAKSPLYAHFIETLEGLPTIRAFGWEREFQTDNDERLDRSQRPFYLLLCVQQWLALVLDCLAAGFVLLLVGLAVALADQISAGFAGVALTNMISLSSLMTGLVQVWTEMETSITSIQRIRDFEATTSSEHHEKTFKPSLDWPSRGAIDITGLDAAYREDTALVLQNVTMSIQPGEKVGICGRTGSGKTSFMSSILRMIGIRRGVISIDGVDIASIDVDLLRQAITVVPQEPYIMAGSYRLNSDPMNARTDEETWTVLKKLRLDELVRSQGGLDVVVSQDSLSHGEKQLLSLARAILKRSRIVILDEATSNIDLATEQKISEIIATEFEGCTVITIAHRLEPLLRSDRIAVLEEGELVEFDTPDALLKQESRFKSLFKPDS